MERQANGIDVGISSAGLSVLEPSRRRRRNPIPRSAISMGWRLWRHLDRFDMTTHLSCVVATTGSRPRRTVIWRSASCRAGQTPRSSAALLWTDQTPRGTCPDRRQLPRSRTRTPQ